MATSFKSVRHGLSSVTSSISANTAAIATNTAASRGFRGKGNGGADATAADYTAVLDDAGKVIAMNRATAQTATIPLTASVAFVAEQDVLTWRQDGAGAFTVQCPGGTVTAPPGKTLVSNGVGAYVSAHRVTGTNVWKVYGDLVPS